MVPARTDGLWMIVYYNMADPDCIAETYLQLHRQHRSTWAFEVVLRPWVEKWRGAYRTTGFRYRCGSRSRPAQLAQLAQTASGGRSRHNDRPHTKFLTVLSSATSAPPETTRVPAVADPAAPPSRARRLLRPARVPGGLRPRG